MNENAAFFVALQTGVPPLALGEPGTAKTRTTEAFAKVVGRHYECVIGSQSEPCDIAGYPHFSTAHGRPVQACAPPEWKVNLEHSPTGGLLHLDELLDCAPAIQAAMLQLLTHGVPNTWICATGNPEECGTNGYSLAPTTVNRLCVLDWRTPIRGWTEGMVSDFKTDISDFPVLPQNWRDFIPTARAVVTSFTTKVDPGTLQKLPADAAARGKPWPSLRAWTNGATMIAACTAINAPEELLQELVTGCVGQGAAMSFLTWRKKFDLPNPEDLLADPSSFKVQKRGDVAHVVLSSIVAAVLNNNTEKRWLAAWEIASTQSDDAPDIVAVVFRPLMNNKPNPEISTPDKVRRRLMPILKAIGN